MKKTSGAQKQKRNQTEKQILIMGILNVTPDSFSDGGRYLAVPAAVSRAKEMAKEGADIIDIGGQSTRPGAVIISEGEEIRRIEPVIRAIRKALPNIGISVDTNRASVASAALLAGADIVNSLGGFSFDPALADVVAKAGCPIVIYHIRGTPETMQKGTIAYKNVTKEINAFFKKEIAFGEKHGVEKGQFVLDPGVGFGKTNEHNLEIIRNFADFLQWGMPLAVGVSRKSHLGSILQEKLGLKKAPVPEERLEAGLAETAIAVQNGAGIARTHDVLATAKFLAVLEELI